MPAEIIDNHCRLLNAWDATLSARQLCSCLGVNERNALRRGTGAKTRAATVRLDQTVSSSLRPSLRQPADGEPAEDERDVPVADCGQRRQVLRTGHLHRAHRPQVLRRQLDVDEGAARLGPASDQVYQ